METSGRLLIRFGYQSVSQEFSTEMLQKMTRLYESIAVRRSSPDVPYIEIAQSNLMSAWGKQLQVCATEGELLQNSPSEGVADVSNDINLNLMY